MYKMEVLLSMEKFPVRVVMWAFVGRAEFRFTHTHTHARARTRRTPASRLFSLDWAHCRLEKAPFASPKITIPYQITIPYHAAASHIATVHARIKGSRPQMSKAPTMCVECQNPHHRHHHD